MAAEMNDTLGGLLRKSLTRFIIPNQVRLLIITRVYEKKGKGQTWEGGREGGIPARKQT